MNLDHFSFFSKNLVTFDYFREKNFESSLLSRENFQKITFSKSIFRSKKKNSDTFWKNFCCVFPEEEEEEENGNLC